MKRPFLFWICTFVLVSALAALSALIALHLSMPIRNQPAQDYHGWIHAELGLSDEQERHMTLLERRFEELERHLQEVIRLANRELADAIYSDRDTSGRVEAAVARIHTAHGELQRATLAHIFEMKPYLTPEQYDRLIELTAMALRLQGGE
jgi:Spy/CpxP family protein refolding chaperone